MVFIKSSRREYDGTPFSPLYNIEKITPNGATFFVLSALTLKSRTKRFQSTGANSGILRRKQKRILPCGARRTRRAEQSIPTKLVLVRGRGLEPPSLSAHAPQACSFTNFDTRACSYLNQILFPYYAQCFLNFQAFAG